MAKNTNFKTNLASVTATQILIFILGFALSILNARFIGPVGVGVFALLKILKDTSISLTDFGLSRACRYYSANGQIPYNVLKKVVFRLSLIMAFVVLIGIVLLKFLPINIWDKIEMDVYLFFLPAPFFFVLTMYLRHLLHGQLLIKEINISEILERVLYIVLFLVFVWILDLGLVGVSISLSLSIIFLYLQLLLVLKRYKPIVENDGVEDFKMKTVLKKLWGYGQWTYYSSFLNYVFQNFPVLFLKSSTDSFAQIGFFNKATGLANYPKIPATPLSGLLFSYNAGSSIDTANSRTEILCRFSFWTITFLFGGLALFIEPIITLLYGKDFLPAANIFIVLYPSIVLYVQSLYLSTSIAARGYNKQTFTIRIKSLPIILIAAFLLIYNYGLMGAALSVSFSSTVMWIQYVIQYRKVTGSGLSNLLVLRKTDWLMVKNLSLALYKKIKK